MSKTGHKPASTSGRSPSGFIKILKSIDEVDGAETIWRELERRSTAPLVWFQGFEWCRNWLAFHAGTWAQPRIVILEREGEAIAIWPLMLVREVLGLKVLKALGEPHTQYANILTVSGMITEAEASLLRQAVTGLIKADAAHFTHVPEGSPLAAVLHGIGQRSSDDNESTLVDLPGNGKGYEAMVSKGTQRNSRYGEKKLQALGAITFSALRPGDSGYDARIGDCLRMKEAWLRDNGRAGRGLAFANHDAFLASLGRGPAAGPGSAGNGRLADGPHVYVLSAGDRPVSIEVGFLQRGHYYGYLAGFEPALKQAKPGKVRVRYLLNWLAAHQVKTLDTMPNPSSFKDELRTRGLRVSAHAVPISAMGMLYALVWSRAVMPMAKRAFQALPTRARTVIVQALRGRVAEAQ